MSELELLNNAASNLSETDLQIHVEYCINLMPESPEKSSLKLAIAAIKAATEKKDK